MNRLSVLTSTLAKIATVHLGQDATSQPKQLWVLLALIPAAASSSVVGAQRPHVEKTTLPVGAVAERTLPDEKLAQQSHLFRPLRPVANLPKRKLAPFYPGEEAPEPQPTETLADAIALAYRSNPTLQARRNDLRATDDNLGLALSELRPTAEIQLTGQYDRTVPGRVTQANRSPVERLRSPNVIKNNLGAQLVVDQPLYTGGKVTADIAAASAEIRAGRASLRANEGDLLLQTISAYLDVRRDTRSLRIREANLTQLQATLAEVVARREAGELTRTDIAQSETQLGSALAQYNLTREQLEQSRAAYASLVGFDPGQLALEPALPQLPATIDEAFDRATVLNPELAQARFTEIASRERITAARAAGRPNMTVRGMAGLSGKAVPFHSYNDDQSLTVRGILTVPLSAGGRTAALISQSMNTNTADRIRIEAARRLMVQSVANAWNQVVTAGRNIAVGEQQVRSAETFYEGTFEEYRAGLRSTFDVLFAQGTLRDARIALISAQRDRYVAQAALLRHIGLLEVRNLLIGVGLYDPTAHVRSVERRAALPWDPAIRALDRVARPLPNTKRIEQPGAFPQAAQMAPAGTIAVPREYSVETPYVPQPGTVGRPRVEKRH